MSKGKQYTNEFKLDAVNYRLTHQELTTAQCANNLGVGKSTLSKWIATFKNEGSIATRGSGNYQSDEVKETARLRKELKDTQDALNILKKAMGILSKD
ncbi:transposase [Breznakia sp. PF5-3]|uniref:transposase n=1 Tax=unclassified Breznakia TaxID=2623764 RepID=UPI00240653FE|nr:MULTISPECIES: transposase [unclassified Breznakia]MDF9823848.1 transposase [Breznakia sp. PM6-1]MDF9834586.1 transposase [Breznakia sp. PF5-3]MDF9836797.1 transposase [Breznakia sp. PFB2-8]MDF9858754.1 transposase [Breznakia sp. PH5-24]